MVIHSPGTASPARQERNASSLRIPSRPGQKGVTAAPVDLVEPPLVNELTPVNYPAWWSCNYRRVIRGGFKEKKRKENKKSDPSCQRFSEAFRSLRESLELLPSSITHAKADLVSRSRSVQLLGLGPVSFPTATPHLSSSTNTDSIWSECGANTGFVFLGEVDRIRPVLTAIIGWDLFKELMTNRICNKTYKIRAPYLTDWHFQLK